MSIVCEKVRKKSMCILCYVSVSEEQSLKRETLREIEVRVLKYADELEAGLRARRAGLALQQQIHHYRRKLIKKVTLKIFHMNVK